MEEKKLPKIKMKAGHFRKKISDFISNKKIVLLIGIILVLAAGTLVYVIYWQKTHLPADAAVKAKCLEDVDKTSDEQVIEKINTLAFATKAELVEINKNAASYLICEFSKEKSDLVKTVWMELHDRTANLINSLKISEKTKKVLLEKIADVTYAFKEEGLFDRRPPNEIALKPIETICPAGKVASDFLQYCLKLGPLSPANKGKISAKEREQAEYNCNHICDLIASYTDDPSKFESSLSSTWYRDPGPLLYQSIGRMALAYRIGGKSLASKVLDLIPNAEVKEKVKKYPESLDFINCKEYGFDESKSCEKKIYEECAGTYEKMKDLICGIEARKSCLNQ